MKKRLLIMASLFYPQKNGGGPPVSIKNLVDSIYDEFDIYIISTIFILVKLFILVMELEHLQN